MRSKKSTCNTGRKEVKEPGFLFDNKTRRHQVSWMQNGFTCTRRRAMKLFKFRGLIIRARKGHFDLSAQCALVQKILGRKENIAESRISRCVSSSSPFNISSCIFKRFFKDSFLWQKGRRGEAAKNFFVIVIVIRANTKFAFSSHHGEEKGGEELQFLHKICVNHLGRSGEFNIHENAILQMNWEIASWEKADKY